MATPDRIFMTPSSFGSIPRHPNQSAAISTPIEPMVNLGSGALQQYNTYYNTFSPPSYEEATRSTVPNYEEVTRNTAPTSYEDGGIYIIRPTNPDLFPSTYHHTLGFTQQR